MNLHRDILRLAVPSILANITVPLVGMVDIAVAGHLGASGSLGAAALIGGISIGTMLFDMLYWNFGFLRGGTGGLTAQAYGRHRAGVEEAAGDIAVTLKRALSIALGSGLVMVALQWVVVQVAFLLVKCTPEVQTLATQYFYIRIWAVAWGTLIAQWTGFTYASIAVLRRYGWVLKHAKQGGHASGFRKFFVLNRDLFLRSVCMIAVYIGFTMISARYGDMMLAVGAILMKLLMIFSYFTDGFAYAGEALTGRFIGEGSPDGVRSTIRQTFVWSLGVTVLFFLVYGVGGVPLLRLMTSDPSVVEAGREFIPWLLLMPVIGCPAFTWDGIFTGATASKDLRNSTVWCVVGFFGVWFAGIGLLQAFHETVPETLAIHLLMAAYFTHLLVRAAYLTLRWRKAIPYA